MARPTNWRIAQREKFLGDALDEMISLLFHHKNGSKLLETNQLIQLCQPMLLKDMATKLEVDNLNDLTGEQKYALMMRYLDTLPDSARPRITS